MQSKSQRKGSNIAFNNSNKSDKNTMKIPEKIFSPYHSKKYHLFGRRHKLPKISMEEIKKHDSNESCWIIVNGFVLDITKFLPYHPVGAQCIINNGQNCDRDFKFHGKQAQKLFFKFVIGRVKKKK
eukprot:989119_1